MVGGKEVNDGIAKKSVTYSSSSKIDADAAAGVCAAMTALHGVRSSSQQIAPPAAAVNAAAEGGEAGPKEANKKELQDALAGVRKAHSEWDRRRREFNALVRNSKNCQATSGGWFERRLARVMTKGDELDQQLMEFEFTFTSLDNDKDYKHDIEEAASVCHSMVAEIKGAAKCANGLKAGFKAVDGVNEEDV